MKRTLWASLFAITTIAFLATPAAQAEPTNPVAQGSSLERDYSRGSLTTLDADLTPLVVGQSSPYFWANYVRVENSGGNGGYIGLQSNGYRRDGSRGKTALFAMWGANASLGPKPSVCRAFDNEGSGQSCMAPFQWHAAHTYRLRISRLNQDRLGQWWSGYVYDRNTGANTLLGKIRVPFRGRLASHTQAFTEYFGPALSSCSAQPYSLVKWGPSSGNNGAVRVTRSDNNLYGGNCENARMTAEPDGTYQEGGSVGSYYTGQAQICSDLTAPYYYGQWQTLGGVTAPSGSDRPSGYLFFGAQSWVTPQADSDWNNWMLEWGPAKVKRSDQCPVGH